MKKFQIPLCFILTSLGLTREALAQQHVYMLEKATDSVWISRDTENMTIISEWKENGSILNYVGSFNPFMVNHPKLGDLNQVLNVNHFEGQFGILSGFRNFFARNSDGGWSERPIFSKQGYLDCNETPSSNPCLAYYNDVDSRGQLRLNVIDEKYTPGDENPGKGWYWTDKQYRQSTPIETKVSKADYLSAAIWADDASYAIVPSIISSGVIFYNYITADSNTLKSIELNDKSSLYNLQKMLKINGRLMAIVFSRNPATYQIKAIRIYEIQDALDEHPKANLLFQTPATNEDVFLGVDQSHIYLKNSNQIFAFNPQNLQNESLLNCDQNPDDLLRLAHSSESSLNVYTFCGNNVITLNNGKITREIRASGKISGGAVLDETNGEYDLVIELKDGSLERLRSGKPSLMGRLSPISPAPGSNISAVWDEAFNTCAVVELSDKSSDTYCQEGSAWAKRSLSIGVPIAVYPVTTGTWALSPIGGEWVAFYRDSTAKGSTWQKIQSWPRIDAQPSIIPHGYHSIAIHFGSRSTWIYDGNKFVESYLYDRNKDLVAKSVIDASGFLYEPCGTIQDYFISLCRISKSGDVLELPLKIDTQMINFLQLLPLKRGIFVQSYNDRGYRNYSIIRNQRIIELGNLYGEFSNKEVSVSQLVNGEVVFEVPSDGKYFIFDGISLTRSQVTPPRHGRKISSGASLIQISKYPNIKQVWRGIDGLWRSSAMDMFAPLNFGESPLDALYQGEGISPNFVNHSHTRDGQAYIATDDGLWTCGIARGTIVTSSSTELNRTEGCERIFSLPMLKKVFYRTGKYVALQGQRVFIAKSQNDPAAVDISRGTRVSNLEMIGDVATWIEDQKLIRYDTSNNQRTELNLPTDDQDNTQKVSGNWYCGQAGLFHFANTSWTKVWERCIDLHVTEESAVATDGSYIFKCKEGSCVQGAALPKPYMSDSILGTLAKTGASSRFAVVLGQNLFELSEDGSTLTDVTPHFARGSLLLTEASSLEDGVLALKGGGVVILSGAQTNSTATHIRIE